MMWRSLGLGLCLTFGTAVPVSAGHVTEARFEVSPQRYPHNIMGSLIAHTALVVFWARCKT